MNDYQAIRLLLEDLGFSGRQLHFTLGLLTDNPVAIRGEETMIAASDAFELLGLTALSRSDRQAAEDKALDEFSSLVRTERQTKRISAGALYVTILDQASWSKDSHFIFFIVNIRITQLVDLIKSSNSA